MPDMNLGGVQKQSLIDYPGKVSCVLFLSGCNFDCPYCHNPDLARGCAECPVAFREDAVFDFLEKRRGFLDGVVISGGEPTLQPDLAALCASIKKMGYPVKLDTNGSRPDHLADLMDQGLVDYVAMDIKTDPFHYAPVIRGKADPADIIRSIGMIMSCGLPYEFKTTCVKPLVTAEAIENICLLIQGARLYAIQQFHLERNSHVLHPEFFEDRDRVYADEDLLDFADLAGRWVEKCIVRL